MYRVPSVDHLCTNIRCRSNYHSQRSFGQSNIFTGMCQSFCPWGRGDLPMMSLPTWVPGPMFLLGKGVSAWSHVPSGESLSSGVSVRETPKRDSTNSGGRYASYWNAFLLILCTQPFHALCFVSKCTKFPLTQMKRTPPEKSYWHIVYVFSYPQPTENCLQHSNT